MKQCVMCKKEKELSSFYRGVRKRIVYYDKKCKECRTAMAKERRRKQREAMKIHDEMKLHRCVKCDQVKPYSEFHRDNSTVRMIRNTCKECSKDVIDTKSYQRYIIRKEQEEEKLDKLKYIIKDKITKIFAENEERFSDILEYI